MWTNPLVRAGIVLGMGFGGFADGIILHQILGWHHLVCVTAHCRPTSIEQLQLQNTQDGYFHLGLWLVTLVGMVMLFRAARPDERARVLQRFYTLPEPLIERFYAGRTTLGDAARILLGKPPVSVRRALGSIFEAQVRPLKETT